jgi:hemoglobin/transferrin/lactoferrin receptor protein
MATIFGGRFRALWLAVAIIITGTGLMHPAHAASRNTENQQNTHNATSPAAGKETPRENTGPVIRLDKIVVSATRTEHSAFEAPASVVTMDKEAIERQQATSLRDILEGVPNLEFSDPTNPFIQKPSLRGLEPDQTIFKIDGARQNYTSQSGIGHAPAVTDPDMLKQVEVLRGPSSALHGSGGIGGVISMRTKDASDLLEPGSSFGGKVKTGYMSATHQSMNSLSLYGRHGIFDVLAHGVYRDFGDTQTTNPSPSKDTSYKTGYSRSSLLKLSAFPDDSQYLSLAYSYNDGRFDSTRAHSTFTEQEHKLVGNYEIALPDSPWLDLKLTTQTAWRDNEYMNDAPRELKDEYRSVGGSLQNTSRFELFGMTSNALTYGVDYYRENQQGTDFGLADPSRPKASADDLGLFIQNEMVLFDRLTLIPAMRYTSYSRSSDSDIAEDQSEERVTPKLTAVVKIAPWLNVFGTYAESYRPPSMDEIYFAMDNTMPWGTIRVLPNPDLKPESAQTWEFGASFGFDSVFADADPLRFKAVYFREDIKNLIEAQMVKDFSSAPFDELHYQSVNVSKAERFGYELELEYGIGALSLAASYGKTIGHDKETRERVGGSPEKLSLRVGYLLASYDLDLFWKSRFVSTHKYYNVFENKEMTRNPYAVHGVGFAWTPRGGNLEGFRLDFGVDNLFDSRYTNSDGAYEVGQNIKMAVSYSF